MGSDASVYVFDHERYVRKVVPVVVEWLRTLHLDEPIDRATVAFWTDALDSPVAGTDLVAHSTTLGADLRYLGSPNRDRAWFESWEARRCRSDTCPSQATCPWHRAEEGPPFVANELILWLIARTGCLGQRLFVGRTTTTAEYAAILTGL